MPKPGRSPNRSNPLPSAGLAAAAAVGRMSSQTRDTCQCSDNPDRMRPMHMAPGPSGRAVVERDAVMDGQTADLTSRTRKTYQERGRILRGE